MRLSADILAQAEQRTNALNEREIILRGLAIPTIEHLAATRDQFDAMDFSDNTLSALTNFPRLLRLSSLSCSGNSIETVDGDNLKENVPSLQFLNLSENKIAGLHEVTNIARGCPKLEFLTLMGNPVTKRQHYRLFVIHRIPTLKVLDFVKIKQSERDRAKRLANSAAGAALEGDVKYEAREAAKAQEENGTKTFTPGQGTTAKESFVTNFSPEQKAQIRKLITEAESPQMIELIESYVMKGQFPSDDILAKHKSTDDINGGSGIAQGGTKRSLEEVDNRELKKTRQ